MKYTILFILFIISCFVNAQNLVPNPSFEEYYTCPLSAGGLGVNGGDPYIKYWYSMSYTPDYMHFCSGNPDASNYPTSNAWGYQEPYDGDGYISLISINGVMNEREYIAIELSEPLLVNTEYDISFYTSDADGGEIEYIDCVSNNIGIKLLVHPPNYWDNEQSNLPLLPDNFSHINMDEILVDSIGWTLVEGSIIADQAYTHLVIGNFYTDNNTDFTQTFESGCESMHFIDYVCVVEQGNDCEIIHTSIHDYDWRNYSIPTLVNDFIDMSNMPTNDIFSYHIYDVYGKLFSYGKGVNSEIETTFLTSGIYILQVKLKNGLFKNYKFIKE